MVESMTEHAYVKLERDAEGYPPFESEELDVRKVKGDIYEVLSSPVFLSDLAHGDHVQVVRLMPEDTLWVKKVVMEGDGWNVRIIPLRQQTPEGVRDEFLRLGVRALATPFGIVRLEGNGRPANALVARVIEGRESGEWDTNWGVVPAGMSGSQV